MTEPKSERRVPYGAWVEVSGQTSFYLAHSLSPAALRLLAANPPPPGRAVHLHLVVENERRVMQLGGEVVTRELNGRDPPSFAVRFVDLDAERRRFLADLFDEAYSI